MKKIGLFYNEFGLLTKMAMTNKLSGEKRICQTIIKDY